jgi:DNA-binding protein WhiA
VAYLKDADEIAEFLRLTGAFQAVLDYENIRARKSLKSSVLRVVNMDRANVSRAVEASIKQLGDIRLIDEEIGLSRLPHALRNWLGPGWNTRISLWKSWGSCWFLRHPSPP